MKTLKIAFIPLIRTTFDVPLAEEMVSKARKSLLAAGFELIGPEHSPADLQSIEVISKDLSLTEIDLLLIFQATFTDSSLVVTLAEKVKAPLFLWAIPETWTGERLRLNSLCGINLAGHALTLRKINYDYAYALPQDMDVLEKIRTMALAGFIKRKLSTARLGVVGEHPIGMDTCKLDEALLDQLFGIQIQHIALQDVFAQARAVTQYSIDQTRAILDTRLDNLASLEQTPLKGTLGVYNALKQISNELKLDGLAVRCWPEFFTEMGCAACGAMSMLSDGFGGDSPMPCSCEADINGTLTQLILQIVADAPAFGTDIVGVDKAQDLIALWHCGLAPLSMADTDFPVRGGLHSNRKVPLVMDFSLKPGKITFARISQATGELRLVLGTGEMLAKPKPFSGTSGTLKVDFSVNEFLDLLMKEGLEHHISLVYGNYVDVLYQFANLVGLPILIL